MKGQRGMHLKYRFLQLISSFSLLTFAFVTCSAEGDAASKAKSSSKIGPVQAELDAYAKESMTQMPAFILDAGKQGTEELVKSKVIERALKVGSKAPAFVLPDASGKPVSSESFLANGPMVLIFYRGAWCPFCNIYLRALQRALPEILSAGGTVVAISGETPEHSIEVKTTDSLQFPVLSDTGLVVARQYGLAYEVPTVITEAVKKIGFDLAAYYGTPKAELPISATYVIAKDGTIAYAFLDVDYKKRGEPSDVVAALKKLKR